LKFLSLSNTNITNAAAAWIAGGSSNNLILLALKNTKVNKHGLRSIRGHFPYSDLTDNDNFFGFWPKSRVDDQKLMNSYNSLIKGITLVQSRYRAYVAKIRVVQLFRRKRYEECVILVQRMARIYIANRKLMERRMMREKQETAAKSIKKLFKTIISKAKLRKLKEYARNKILARKAVRIQTRWRMYQAISKLLSMKQQMLRIMKTQDAAATIMQSCARKYFAKTKVQRIKEFNHAKKMIQLRKCLLIQRAYRGYKARKFILVIRMAMEQRDKLRAAATRQIQRFLRVKRLQHLMKERCITRQLRLNAATKIQALTRGTLTRWYVDDLLIQEKEDTRFQASIILQKTWRRKEAWILVKALRVQRAELDKIYHNAAIRIQVYARRSLAKSLLKRMKKEEDERIRAMIELEILAAITIQSFYRGMLGRRRFNAMLREKRGKWKELFDEQQQRRFFYNKLTGAIRWRMPQDLLDLIPRSKCDNCNYYEGMSVLSMPQ
jgi:hypothetical protein